MSENEVMQVEHIAKEMKCSISRAHDHRRAIRTLFNYRQGAVLTYGELMAWRRLYNTLDAKQRQSYFNGVKPETR